MQYIVLKILKTFLDWLLDWRKACPELSGRTLVSSLYHNPDVVFK